MKTNKFIATAIAIISLFAISISANAQIKKTGRVTYSSKYVPTSEQKKELEKSEDVKLVERNGSHNFYIGAKGGITFEGEPMAGGMVGLRIADQFRIEAEGMYNLDNMKEGNYRKHSYAIAKVVYDLIPSSSAFYKKHKVNFNVAAFVGGMEQGSDLKKFPNSEGIYQLSDLRCKMELTYGAGIGISKRIAPRWQLGAEISYFFMPTEKDFVEDLPAFKADIDATAQAKLDSQKWCKNMIMGSISLRYHF